MVVAVPTSALTIVPTFDTSVTSQAAAGTIESAFNAVAGLFDGAIDNPATVNINVGWGEINGTALPSSAVGASQSYLEGYYSYSQMKAFLTAAATGSPTNQTLASAVANLPMSAPTGATNYVVTAALGKALGIVAADSTATDGFIGFAGSPSGFGFTPAAVTSRLYDFQAVAAHEISEVLGRISGLDQAAWRTPLDLYRYSAPGTLSFAYRTPSYFSIDGGTTALLAFNSGSRGDRGDWNTVASSTDSFDAFIGKGQRKSISAIDLALLDATGWGGTNAGSVPGALTGNAFSLAGNVPEPASWALMLAGFGVVGGVLRRRRGSATVSC